MAVKVNDPADFVNHTSVPDAYAAALAEVLMRSGLNVSDIDAEMEVTGDDTASLAFVVSIPASMDGNVLKYEVPVPEVEEKIQGMDVQAFSDLVSEKIDMEFGIGTYKQKVMAPGGADLDKDAVSFALSSCRLTAAAMLVASVSWLC